MQLARFVLFLVMVEIISRVPLKLVRDFTFPVYAALLIALVLVEAIGGIAGGSQRWINLGFMQFQPSELMKVAIVLTVARFYSLLPIGQVRTVNAIWPALLLIGVPTLLVLVQPDLGTAMMIAAGGVIVMFLAGLPLRLFVGSALAGAAIIPIAFSFLHDYQQKRVLIFMDPESDPLGAGYHISQSKIAIGSGGIMGKGFLNGTQSHLDYLPEGHTDFVFATMAEEWGMLGGIGIICALFLLIRWGMRVAQRTEDRYARLVAAGLASTIFLVCRDQPHDGHGPRAGGGHSPALHVLWRLLDADRDAVHRHHPQHRPQPRQARRSLELSAGRQARRAPEGNPPARPFFRWQGKDPMLTAPLTAGQRLFERGKSGSVDA